MHLPRLIQDLALILAAGGAVALLCRWLKQPIVLGYIVAGILISPQFTLTPNIVETESVKVWAELGVIFFLFVLGLEFSLKKLLDVGKPAFIAAACEVIMMTLLGFGIGSALGWSSMDSLFLGGILAISSTTIILKAFEEQGFKTQSFTGLVFGILVIEDLFAILLLALLATIAAAKTSMGMDLIKQIGWLTAFLAVVIGVGLWLIPRFFRAIRSQLTDEMRLIVSLALCLGLVVASTSAGFSPALGAFLMGALMGETPEGERVERFLRPIRDLFGAIFFVSVGMLVDIQVILSNPLLILAIAALTIVGKIVFTAGGAILAGQDRKTAFQAGASLAQIGEFSFIIATLGLSLNVIRPDLYPITVSIALITTFTTPYLIRFVTRAKGGRGKIWDSHLVEFEIHPSFKFAGAPLKDLKIREKYGVSVIALIRGDRKILAPGRMDSLMPYDRIVIFGPDAQLLKMENFLKLERFDSNDSEQIRFSFEKIHIEADDSIVGKNLRESRIRERAEGIVLGIERDGKRVINPDALAVIHAGDILWIYGDKDHLRSWNRGIHR